MGMEIHTGLLENKVVSWMKLVIVFFTIGLGKIGNFISISSLGSLFDKAISV